MPFTSAYVHLVLTLCLMIGLIKLALGIARLGALVNFISTTVVVGFTAGAGILIAALCANAASVKPRVARPANPLRESMGSLHQ